MPNPFAKQHRSPAALPVVALLLLLCACAPVQSDPVLLPTEKPMQLEVQTTFIEVVTPTPEPKVLDLDAYALEGEDGIYDVFPLLCEPGLRLLHVGFSGEDQMLAISTDEAVSALYVDRLDLKTGERERCCTVPRQTAKEEPDALYVYQTNPLAVNLLASDELLLFAPDDRSCRRFPLNGRAASLCRWDGERLLLTDHDTHTLVCIAPDGTETALYHPDYRYSYVSLIDVSSDGRYAAFSATNSYTNEEGTLLVDLSDGTELGWASGSARVLVDEAGWSMLTRTTDWSEDGNRTSLVFQSADAPDADTTFWVRQEYEDYYPDIYPVPGGYLMEDWNGPLSLTYADRTGRTIVRRIIPLDRYDAVVEELRAAAEQAEPEEATPGAFFEDDPEEWVYDGDGGFYLAPQIEEGCSDGKHVVMRITVGEETVGVVLWDVFEGERTETQGITMTEPMVRTPEHPDPVDYGAYAARVERIQADYGITVLLDREAALKLGTHAAEPLPIAENRETLDEAFAILEETLAAYPPQFFRLLCRRELDGIVIELTGTIRATNEYALDYPSALTCTRGNYRVIAFDAGYVYDLRYTIFHEVSHMIDSQFYALDESVWSDAAWDALNPKGFSYYYAYNDDNGNPYDSVAPEEYTRFDRGYVRHHKTGNVYFVDTYSKTFPTEDRAVLLGTLLRDDTEDDVLRCPHVLEKLRYYSQAIRALFDPDGTIWTAPTIWEERLDALEGGAIQDAA